MKKFIPILIATIFIFSCSKDNSTNNSNQVIGNYDFHDLATNENLIDTIRVLNANSIPSSMKLFYKDKAHLNLIKGFIVLDSAYLIDTIYYSGNNINFIGIKNTGGTNLLYRFKYKYENNLVSRVYQYEDDNPSPLLRQLGYYYTYSPSGLSKIEWRYIFDVTQRVNLTFVMTRNSNLDIDSIYEIHDNLPPTNVNYKKAFIKVSYGSTLNKLRNNANLRDFRYLFVNDFQETPFNQIVIGGQILISDNIAIHYPNIVGQVFFDLLTTSNFLPKSISVEGRIIYITYKFNSNGYLTSVSMGDTPNFSPLLNELFQFTYYKKP